MTTESEVEVLELKRLLHAIMDSGYDIKVRFRRVGELWTNSFCRIVSISDLGVALLDERTSRLYFIRDLSHLMAFELDSAFQNYQPNFHYTIATERNLSASAG